MLLLLQQPLFIINQASVAMQIKKPTMASSSIENASQLFKEIKQLMKMRSTNKISMQQFKQFYHNTTDQALGRIMMYINSKTRFDKSLPNEQCANILRTLLAEDKGVNGKFRISAQEMVYESKYIKIVDKKTLLQEIQNTPQGLQVTEEILKFAGTDVRDHIQELIYQRAIIPIKSKAIEKGKIKGNNYEGYLLFPIPSEVKEVLPIILEPQMKKNDFESQTKNLEERQEKLKRVYRTKTSVFRTDFDNICIQNVGRGQGKIGQNQSLQSIQRIFGGWNEINKMSVPNFDRQAEQWYKNRK